LCNRVLNTLGHGLVEKPYENALVVEFGLQAIPFSAATFVRCPLQRLQGWFVRSRSNRIQSVVVDAKVIDRITDHERGLMLNYLRTTKLRAGVILNFKRSKLEWERIVL
jgi:GxxExxY protein